MAIWGGANGARLTHDHKKQYCYILQVLFFFFISFDSFLNIFFFLVTLFMERNYSGHVQIVGAGRAGEEGRQGKGGLDKGNDHLFFPLGPS